MKDYSQHSEQGIILDYFKDLPVGFLLDCGANDGITFSNSRALIEQGWYGVLVEPSEKTFKQLVKNYTGFNKVVLHNVAIGTYNGTTDFYESGPLVSKKDHSLVSSMKEAETHRWTKKSKPEDPIVKFKKTTVPVITFAELLKNSADPKFDFITIDVEGMELEILQQIDFNTIGCSLICIEYNGRDYQEYDRLIPFPLIYKNKTNLIYAAKK